MKDLAQAWTRTVGSLATAGDLTAVGADLLARYEEVHRRYHGPEHLQSVLHCIEELAAHAEDLAAVRLAAWFHDAIYDPRRTDNEQQSARLAQTQLAMLGVDLTLTAEVARLVLSTAAHRSEEGDGNAAVVCDADLAILGADGGTYAAYREAVRAEYAHLDDESFNQGRIRVLRDLLAHDSLYATTTAQTRWEYAARMNISAELESIS